VGEGIMSSSHQSNRTLTKNKWKQTRSVIKTYSVALSENKAQILLKQPINDFKILLLCWEFIEIYVKSSLWSETTVLKSALQQQAQQYFVYAHANESKRSTTVMKNVFTLQQTPAAGTQNSIDAGHYGYCQWPAKSCEIYESSDNQ